jgi:hypothetical protein
VDTGQLSSLDFLLLLAGLWKCLKRGNVSYVTGMGLMNDLKRMKKVLPYKLQHTTLGKQKHL